MLGFAKIRNAVSAAQAAHRRCVLVILMLGLLVASVSARAASSRFDLIGPQIEVSVTHDGVTLPLKFVPNLAEGDRIFIKLHLPNDGSERYRMVAAFLRGAIDRPPNDWFHPAESGEARSVSLSLVVPKGAQQLALFISPERGGGSKAIIGTIRKQPGAFVRAVQELAQASLDRTRLDAFLLGLQQAQRSDPASVGTISPILAQSLAIKLKAECLQQPVESQAACLALDRETLLLADSHSSALADTLSGTPTDLAFQLSATPQGGYGAYSSYIGVVRDLFRVFGAFQSTQLQFIPTLLQGGDVRTTILLNTPLSFVKPTSVMVVALPLIEAPKPPSLRSSAPEAMLCAHQGVVLPVEGAPLIYATDYAHAMTIGFKLSNGTQVSVPLHADASVGGFVLEGALLPNLSGPVIEGQVHGQWGFAPFDGPAFAFSTPDTEGWKAANRNALVVGRSNQVELFGGGEGCVTKVSIRREDGALQPLIWRQSGTTGIVVTVPLEPEESGSVAIVIEGTGRTVPAEVSLRPLQQTGSLDELDVHAFDTEPVLTGTRLDQVQGVTLGGVAFQPGALTRIGKQDRLALSATDSVQAQTLVAGKVWRADVAFTGGRRKSLSVTIAPPRVAVALTRIMAETPKHSGALPIALPDRGVFAQDARLTFAFHMVGDAPLSGRELIEVATADGQATTQIQAGKGYDLQDGATGIVGVSPVEALGPRGYGALRFRVVRDGVASDWAALATIVRLPEIRSLTCVRGKECTLRGNRLFLVKAIGANDDFQSARAVPDGFVATEILTPPSQDGRIFLRLRDAPAHLAIVTAR